MTAKLIFLVALLVVYCIKLGASRRFIGTIKCDIKKIYISLFNKESNFYWALLEHIKKFGIKVMHIACTR